MKKISLILGLFLFSANAFSMTTLTEPRHYRVRCGNIWYYFDCSCGLDAAQGIGQSICDAYGAY